MDAEDNVVSKTSEVINTLDRSLSIAKRKQRRGDRSDFPNVLLISDAGFGKTEMVKQWAKSRGIHLVSKNLGTMGPEAFGGIIARDADDPHHATRLGTNEMAKALDEPNSVLFLDEYNRSKTEVRGAVLSLVQNHVVWDPAEPTGERFLDNFLFTVAAINPPNGAYVGAKEMDPAEMSRFYSVNIAPDPDEHLEFLEKAYTQELNDETLSDEERAEIRGRLALARALLTNEDFTYDSSEEVEEGRENPSYRPLNYRSLKLALDRSNGTKEDFLSVWPHICNPAKLSVVRSILAKYKDVDDKANDALNQDSESEVFKSSSIRDRLRTYKGLNV